MDSKQNAPEDIFKMKVAKAQLKQIIKEELNKVLNEENSPMEILGTHNISDSRALANAVGAQLEKGKIDDSNSEIIEKWLTRRIRQEPNKDLRAALTDLRDDVLRTTGRVDRAGQTGFERGRKRRHGIRQPTPGSAGASKTPMTTLQSLGIGE
jgi:hypothetical protein